MPRLLKPSKLLRLPESPRFPRPPQLPKPPSFAALLVLGGCLGPEVETVTIHRDRFGIPNIFAETAAGASFGAGYAQAEDRLEELLRQYRRAAGTLSEAFGPEFIEHDHRQRLWRHAAVSRERYGEVSPRGRGLIEAYLAGVRLYMKRHPERIPAWAPELEPWMVVALERYIIWGWPAGSVAGDLERAGVRLEPFEPRASNQWVVSGQRTASGAPLALIDPHLSWYGEFRFYEARLYGGELQVAGVGVLGAPLPSLGHSRFASVAMTTGGPDTSDAYEVTIHPHDPSKYLHDGVWRDVSTREETIRVSRGDRIEEVRARFESTHHGPIVARRGERAYAVKIPHAEEVGLTDQVYEMMTEKLKPTYFLRKRELLANTERTTVLEYRRGERP